MSVGAVVALVVLMESVVLAMAVRWLLKGLRSAEHREWPPVLPLGSASTVPAPREKGVLAEEPVAVA